MAVIFELFITFAKIGLFTFGGGYAMISIIENTCVQKKKWITDEEMLNMTVIAESTPGPISINCSTYIGYKQKGILGAVSATFGLIFPSFVIIFLISMFLDNFLEITFVASAFKGIKAAVGILIVDAAFKMLKKMKKTAVSVTILILSFLALMLFNIFSVHISSIIIMVVSAICALSAYLIGEKSQVGGK